MSITVTYVPHSHLLFTEKFHATIKISGKELEGKAGDDLHWVHPIEIGNHPFKVVYNKRIRKERRVTVIELELYPDENNVKVLKHSGQYWCKSRNFPIPLPTWKLVREEKDKDFRFNLQHIEMEALLEIRQHLNVQFSLPPVNTFLSKPIKVFAGDLDNPCYIPQSILTHWSPVFKRMFEIEMTESSALVLRIKPSWSKNKPTFTPDDLLAVFLGAIYAYSNSLCSDPDCVRFCSPDLLCEIMLLSHMYAIHILWERIGSILMAKVNSSNWKFIMERTALVFNDPYSGWTDFGKKLQNLVSKFT